MKTLEQTEREYSAVGRTGLLQRINELENGLILLGWSCTRCGVFNGEEKAKRTTCRSCGACKS